MIVRALDSNGDWIFGVGKNAYLREQYAIAQQIRCRLNSFLGDCFFDLGSGLDWFNLIGSKDMESLRLAVTSAILTTPGVMGIRAMNIVLDRDTRVLTIQYDVQTVYTTMTGQFNFQVQP